MTERDPPVTGKVTSPVLRAAVAVIAVVSLLPVADWVPSAPESTLPPPYLPQYVIWVIGSVVMAVIAWGAARLWPGSGSETGGKRSGRRRRRSAQASPAQAAPEKGGERGRGGALLSGWGPLMALFAVPVLFYAWTGWVLFDGRPLHVDALTQALQAHVYADGRLSVPVADNPRFFSSALVIEHGGRAFSQFPPGWSGLLALGMLLGIPWFVAPLCGGAAVFALWRLLRENGEGEWTAFLTAGLMASSPWFAANAASWMSHVPTLCFILVGSAALVHGLEGGGGWRSGLLAGAALGVATTIRPLEGIAFGIPATVWVLARARSRREDRSVLVGFAAGGTLLVGLLLVYNQVMHGSPALFGFELQWGPEHRLGFHEAPWGPPHTFIRGVQLVANYLLALQLLFFDAPAPSLGLALGGLWLARRLDGVDRYLLAGSTVVLLGYLAFWGEGHDLGPRYLVPLAPVVAIWTVRFGRLLGERTGRVELRRWAYGMVVLLLVSGWALGTPVRWFVYGRMDPLRRVDVSAIARGGPGDALVFVSSPWSIQVQARLRATGMSRQRAEWFYHRVGLCKLDVALADLDERGVTDPDRIVEALRPLAADSVDMVLDPLSGSPGDPYTGLSRADSAAVAVCGIRQYLEEQQGGYMLLAFQAALGPTWTGDGAIVAQDLHEQNRRLIAAHAGREPYRLRPLPPRGTVRGFVLEPLKPDSVDLVWGRFEELQAAATVLPPDPPGS